MIKERKKNLQNILESFGGLHLTAYLTNRGNLIDLDKQIQKTLHEAYEWLHEALPPFERDQFLEPIYKLKNNVQITFKTPSSIGIFRGKNIFQVIELPFEIERSCHIATSFHTKPLLSWIQNDPEFILIHANKSNLDVYLGSLYTLNKIDSFYYKTSEFLLRAKQIKNIFNLPLFFYSDNSSLDKPYLLKNEIQAENLNQAIIEVRKQMKNRVDKIVSSALLEYEKLNKLNLAKKNIFQIAKAAIQGRVKRLIIADDFNIFGKLDLHTGGLALHPMDLDYEDDDLLDDLAQKVLIFGGEVIIAHRHQIPENRPLLAILDSIEFTQDQLFTFDKNFFTAKET